MKNIYLYILVLLFVIPDVNAQNNNKIIPDKMEEALRLKVIHSDSLLYPHSNLVMSKDRFINSHSNLRWDASTFKTCIPPSWTTENGISIARTTYFTDIPLGDSIIVIDRYKYENCFTSAEALSVYDIKSRKLYNHIEECVWVKVDLPKTSDPESFLAELQSARASFISHDNDYAILYTIINGTYKACFISSLDSLNKTFPLVPVEFVIDKE